ncbi:hypothetical protein OCL06_15005 [Alteromonas sp. ASW11-19]|uniref:Uncharacterized protein n=1 Tax=Alteromonas salexigens TaxID=2982530 RepID=A0ABT2VRG4_9ALTE|nr:hypothetical protein [Alteromonas salexigens]MCU7555897.1 hypothetical protein [Alteromonas salexigens]
MTEMSCNSIINICAKVRGDEFSLPSFFTPMLRRASKDNDFSELNASIEHYSLNSKVLGVLINDTIDHGCYRTLRYVVNECCKSPISEGVWLSSISSLILNKELRALKFCLQYFKPENYDDDVVQAELEMAFYNFYCQETNSFLPSDIDKSVVRAVLPHFPNPLYDHLIDALESICGYDLIVYLPAFTQLPEHLLRSFLTYKNVSPTTYLNTLPIGHPHASLALKIFLDSFQSKTSGDNKLFCTK